MRDSRKDIYCEQLVHLGGRLLNSTNYEVEKVDLEEFFLDSTIYSTGHEERLTNCIEHFWRAFWPLIVPSKVLDKIDSGYEFDSRVLLVFMDIIESSKQFNSDSDRFSDILDLKKYGTIKSGPKINRGNLQDKVTLPEKYWDEIWANRGYITPCFYPEFSKNLRTLEWILGNVSEIRIRFEMRDLSIEDLRW